MNRFMDIERFIHSTKTVIACLIGLSIIYLSKNGMWIIITIIVVMCAQIYVGSMLQRAYMRFIGTALGCLFASFILMSLGHNDFSIALALSVAVFVFSYLATGQEVWAYAGTLGAATTAIIMLAPQPTLSFALERFIEISLGILIAAVVSQFVLPIHARSHLKRSQAKTLAQLKDYYAILLMNKNNHDVPITYHDLDEEIIKSLSRQRQLAKESAREPLGLAFNPAHFIKTLTCERNFLRSITFMHMALNHSEKIKAAFTHSSIMQTFNESVIQSLEMLIHALKLNDPSKAYVQIPNFNVMKEELIRGIKGLLPEEMMYLDGFLFSAEILIHNLAQLADLYKIQIHNEANKEA